MTDWTIGADFSEDRIFRYTLYRIWDSMKPMVVFVLLNPSTADEKNNDRTNVRGICYGMDWGFGGICFVNLYAWRSPYPKELAKAGFPVGKANNNTILLTCQSAGLVVAAYGKQKGIDDRIREVEKLIMPFKPKCLGTTKDGYPRHILYLKKTEKLVPYGGLP